MKFKYAIPSLIIVVALTSGLLFSVNVVSAQQDVTISNATASPEDPVTGESISITPTVENLESSNETVKVTDIYIRESGGVSDVARVENLGSLTPGNSLSPSLSMSFEKPGEKNLRVHAVFETESDDHQSVEYPLVIDVEDEDIDMDLLATVDESNETDTLVADFTNFGNSELSNIEVSASQDEEVVARELLTAVDAESSQSVEFDTDEFADGDVTVAAEFESDATDESYTETASVNLTDYEDIDTDLSATVDESNETDTLVADFTNFGNSELSNIDVSASQDGEVVMRELVTAVDAESSRTVEFDTDEFADREVTLTAEYKSDTTDESYTETSSINLSDYGAVEGEIDLSGIETSNDGERILVEGDAANIGSTDAESVQLRIPDTDDVRPVSPSGEYFIGTIEGSEFDTFELTAEPESETTSLPVEIAYIVDDERVTTTQDVAIESMNASVESDGTQGAENENEQGPPSGSGGPLRSLPLPVIGAVLAVVVVGFGVYRWRTQ